MIVDRKRKYLFYFTEDDAGFEEEEEGEQDEDLEEDEYFDFVDAEAGTNNVESSDDNGFADAADSVSYTTGEEEEVRQFSGSGWDFRASSACFNIGNHSEEEGQRRIELQRFQGRKRTERNLNNRNGVTLAEQREFKEQPNWTRECFNKNEEQWDGNQIYRHHDSKRGEGFRGRLRGRPRGGPRGGPWGEYRGGFGQGQRDKQEYRGNVFQEGLRFGCQAVDATPQPQRGRGNLIGPGNLPRTKLSSLGGPEEVARGGFRGVPRRRPRRGPRGGFACAQGEYKENVNQDWGYSNQGYRGRGTFQTVQREDKFGFGRERDQEAWTPQFAHGRGARGQPSHQRDQRGRGRRGSRGRGGGPVYLSQMASISETHRSHDDLHVGHSGEDHLNRRDQGNHERPARAGNRGRSQGGMRRAQSLSNLGMFRDPRG